MKINKLFVFGILILFLSSCAKIEDEAVQASKDSITLEPTSVDTIQSPVIKKTITLSDSILFDYHTNKIGDIIHLIEDTMFYGITDTIELTVSYNTPVNFIIERVGTFHNTRRDNIIIQKIRITPVMEAKLIDPTNGNFQIIPITDQTQIIEYEDDTYTLWQWRVTPLTGGMKNLVLNVNMIVGDHTKSIKIYEDKIYVHITRADKFWIWIKLNWTYLTYAIGLITAILGFLYKEKILHIFK